MTIYKLAQERDQTKLDAYRKTFGNWGDVPPNFRQVSPSEMAASSAWRIYSPIAIEYRQFHTKALLPAQQYFGVHLFVYHDQTGYCTRVMNGCIEYWLFGCEHEMEETSRLAGNRGGMHSARCKKCSYTTSYDTSD